MSSLPASYAPTLSPYQHQRRALERSWQEQVFALLMDMGTGKTKVVIDNFCLLYERGEVEALMIVAPKGVYTNWTRTSETLPGELQTHLWAEHEHTARVFTWRGMGNAAQREEWRRVSDASVPGPRVACFNIEAFSAKMSKAYDFASDLLRAHRTLMVVDESIAIKNPDSMRTRHVTRLGYQATYRRIMTGQPSSGSPSDVWSQFDFLERGLLGHRSFYTFRARYCVMKDVYVGNRVVKQEVGSQNLDELATAVARHSFRVRKSDCLDLPPKVYAPRIEVPLTTEQNRVYAELRRSAMAQLEGGASVTTQVVVAQLEKMHQVVCGHVRADDGVVHPVASGRIEALLELLERTDEQTIVWCGYRPNQGAVARALEQRWGGGSVARWYGDVPTSERERGEEDFQAGRRRFMVASQQSGGRGRTWTAATLVVYFSNTYDLELREQSEDRAHRSGQTRSVTYVDIVCPGTIDEKIIEALREKKDVVRAILSEGAEKWI